MATEENSQPAMKEPVGQQLQKAREKAGLGTGDVAAAQHLRPSVIQAIESGDYSQIDSELFLKGYVRAYAEQVGLDADAVIADLDQELEPIRQQREQEQEANPLVDIERRRRRKRQLAKALFFLVVLGIAGYLAFTFLVPEQGAAPSEAVTEPEVAPEGQGETEALAESERSEPEVVARVENPEPAVVESDAVAAEQRESLVEAIEPDAGEAQAPIEMADTATVEDTRSEPAGAVTEQIPAVVQTPEPVLENPNGLSEVADTGRLEIRFSDDCWVQVSDAAGNRLVNSLQRNGDQIDVAGPAPLRVVIGAVDAVESIRFEGEPVDIGGYRVVNNRSEFTLTI
ncbi:cytoskeleton protein RodZ [Marinobacter sp. es.048]|uniref:RodZ domain-containing protein n=1 Tax=Marinobacter sp. es.048 TaxID=1761795 RepID=UPI000B58FDD6|nr:RodZ domain-containing protein [Marinobacter sp. es.048]SNC75003.1 cytoskeleton protein RodZ [Marinobacter sp. es.048]